MKPSNFKQNIDMPTGLTKARCLVFIMAAMAFPLSSAAAVSFSTSASGGDNPLSAVADATNGVIQGDFDSDGDIDVLAFDDNTYAALKYWQNNGSGVFSVVSGAGNPFNGIAAANNFYNDKNTYIADFDNDGDMDVWDWHAQTANDGTSLYKENTKGWVKVLMFKRNNHFFNMYI